MSVLDFAVADKWRLANFDGQNMRFSQASFLRPVQFWALEKRDETGWKIIGGMPNYAVFWNKTLREHSLYVVIGGQLEKQLFRWNRDERYDLGHVREMIVKDAQERITNWQAPSNTAAFEPTWDTWDGIDPLDVEEEYARQWNRYLRDYRERPEPDVLVCPVARP